MALRSSRSCSFFLMGGSFIVLLFAFGDAKFEFGAAVFEIDGQGDKRHAALGGFALEFP